MQTASLELCKELYELSGWNDCTWLHATKSSLSDARRINPASLGAEFDDEDGCPAYDLGFLLRKLPAGTRLSRNMANPRKRSNYHGEWSAGLYVNIKLADGQQADTPEDATCKLAIELIKQGVLPAGGQT